MLFSRVLLLLLLLRGDDEEEDELDKGALAESALGPFVSSLRSSVLACSRTLVGASELHLLSLSLWRDELLRRVSALLLFDEDFLSLLLLPVVTLLCSKGGLADGELFKLEEEHLGLRDRLSVLLPEALLGDLLLLLLLDDVLLGDLLVLLVLELLLGDLVRLVLCEVLLGDLLPLLLPPLLLLRSRDGLDLEELRTFLDLDRVRRLGLGLSVIRWTSSLDTAFLVALVAAVCWHSESSKSG